MTAETKKRIGGGLTLLLAAFIWGTSFSAQKIGMAQVEAFTFNGVRTLMGACALLPVILFRLARKKKQPETRSSEQIKADRNRQLIYGLICGLILFVAGNFQQFAFNYTSSGKVGFITALYMLLVPVFGLVIGKRQPLFVWLAVVMGCIGTYMVSAGGESGSIGRGELLTICCAVFFACHILFIDFAVAKVDGLLLSFTQFCVAGTLSCICMFIFESPSIPALISVIGPLLYSGVMSCGAAYTLQIVGQKNTPPAIAALIMCLESVFAVLTGWVILDEKLTAMELTGCFIMFAAIILTNIPRNEKKEVRHE